MRRVTWRAISAGSYRELHDPVQLLVLVLFVDVVHGLACHVRALVRGGRRLGRHVVRSSVGRPTRALHEFLWQLNCQPLRGIKRGKLPVVQPSDETAELPAEK